MSDSELSSSDAGSEEFPYYADIDDLVAISGGRNSKDRQQTRGSGKPINLSLLLLQLYSLWYQPVRIWCPLGVHIISYFLTTGHTLIPV